MKVRVARAMAAAGLVAVIAVAGVAQPAQAAEPDNAPADVSVQFAFDWVGTVVAIASSVFGGGGGGDLDAAIQQVISAVEASKTDILDHIDAIASAEVRACVRSHTIELADIDVFPPVILQLWAQEATQCATLASEFFDAVQSMPAADNLGFLIGEIHAIAIAARAKAGFSIVGLMENYIEASESVISKLMPECRWWQRETGSPPWDVVTWTYECEAYNGDQASDSHSSIGGGPLLPEPIDEEAVEDEATRNTSRAVAQDALPKLLAALP